MKETIGRSRYFSLIAVITLLASFLLALLWGVGRAFTAGYEIVVSYGQSSSISLYVIKVVDAFLIAIVLFMLAASIYSLFIERTGLPSRLVARDLPELKSNLSGVIVLVLAVRFAEALFEELLPALDILWLGLATAAVGGMLLVFGHLIGEDEKDRGPRH
jgi:uncharacterized membrane protein YqhA